MFSGAQSHQVLIPAARAINGPPRSGQSVHCVRKHQLVFVILAATLNFLCAVTNEQQIMSVSVRLDMKCYYKSYYKREECYYKSVEFSA